MKRLNWISIVLISVIISNTSLAAVDGGMPQEEVVSATHDWPLVQKAIDCAKSCAVPLTGAFTSIVGFMGFAGASCSAGVCPLVVATGAGGLFTATGIGAALTAFIASAGEACSEGFTVQCGGYIVIPAVIGGVSGYLVVKGYDKLRKWHSRRQQQEQLGEPEEIPSNELAEFVPEEQT